MEKYILFLRWVSCRSLPVVTCSQTHLKWLLLFQSYIPSPLICASWGHLPVLLTFKSLFQCLILDDPNQGKGIKGLAIYLRITFRLISYPSSHWTPHLPFVITSHTPRLSCHPTAYPCSLPWKSRIIHLAFKDLHALFGLHLMPFSSPSPAPHRGVCISAAGLCSPSCQNDLQWSHLLAFAQMFSSAPNGTWKFCLHSWSTFVHVAEKSLIPSYRSCSPLSDLQVKTRVLVYAAVFCWTGLPCDSTPALAVRGHAPYTECGGIKWGQNENALCTLIL